MQINFNIDIIIFLVFLIINLVVGLSYGRGVTTIKDYALGGRNFSTGALVATIVATWVSGSGFFTTLAKTYSDGLYYVIASAGMTLSFIIAAYVFIPRMGEFLGSTSVAEAMGDRYGKQVQVITAIAGLIGSAGSIAVQFRAFGNIFNYFLDFPSHIAIIVAGVIVTIYSAFGGVRSVTFTDILQFFTFGVALPLVGLMIWSQLNNTNIDFSLFKALQDPKFDMYQIFKFNNPKLWEMIPLLLYFAIPGMKPAFYQRISMGKNIEQVKQAFLFAAGLLFTFELSISWIPFLIYNVNPNLESGQLLGYIIDNYTYPGLKGLMMIGITAMAMSTADSYINASSVLFANDIYKPLKLGNKKTLSVSKIFSLGLGCFAIGLALISKDLLKIILTANSYYMPVVTVPLMMTILGFRLSTKSVLMGMFAGITTVLIWNYMNIEADCIVFAMLMNLIFLVSNHYLFEKQITDQNLLRK